MSRQDRKSGLGTKEVNERAIDFRRELDSHTRTVVESFGALLRYAKVTTPQSSGQVDFQINVATASLATAGEGLLRQIREVKLAAMLQDEAAMDREVDQALERIAAERAELEKELEALSNDLKTAYAKAAMNGLDPPPGVEEFPEGNEVGDHGQMAGGGSHAGVGPRGLGLIDPLSMPLPGLS